ncbi:MAG: patatin-like phospholipase family protein [Burkholderiaceae bacterium]|nr:patatin-like phospholipase family protein [Burkholderiaceae bacterium]
MASTKIAIACQGGGSHAAYAAGALGALLPAIEKSKSDLQLVGISGTSGGAICALLAWYGMLKGGSDCAKGKLLDFWQANCAQHPGELLWNGSTMEILKSLSYDFQFSPYVWPLRETETILTQTWPAVAGALGMFNPWGRGGYFQLGPLIEQSVDFRLVEAFGDFCGIALDISQWKQADLLYGWSAQATGHSQNQALRMRLEGRIKAGPSAVKRIRELMDQNKFADAGLLRQAFANWSVPDIEFDPQAPDTLLNKVKAVMKKIPQLLLGAVDVGNGEFTAFSSQKAASEGGVSLKAVLASAALPWLFEAVEIKPEGASNEKPSYYWDGLLSQNPPIKNFLSSPLDDPDQKPNQIWVLQINPSSSDPSKLKENIWDRRNELAGNLSLNQEISFIDTINKRFAQRQVQGLAPNPKDKHVQVHRIVMDSETVGAEAGIELGAWSKSDRSVRLKNVLVRNGQRQADYFMGMHGAIAGVCGNLHNDAYSALDVPEANATLAALRAMKGESGDGLQLKIGETFQPSQDKEPDTTVRWHAIGITERKQCLRVEGETDLIRTRNGGSALSVRDLRITSVELISETPSIRPPADDNARRTGATVRGDGAGAKQILSVEALPAGDESRPNP